MRGAISQNLREVGSQIFQLTLPMRGAMPLCADFFRGAGISTHAPHAGSDMG